MICTKEKLPLREPTNSAVVFILSSTAVTSTLFFSLVLQGKVRSVEGETVTMLPKHEDLKVRGVEALKICILLILLTL